MKEMQSRYVMTPWYLVTHGNVWRYEVYDLLVFKMVKWFDVEQEAIDFCADLNKHA